MLIFYLGIFVVARSVRRDHNMHTLGSHMISHNKPCNLIYPNVLYIYMYLQLSTGYILLISQMLSMHLDICVLCIYTLGMSSEMYNQLNMNIIEWALTYVLVVRTLARGYILTSCDVCEKYPLPHPGINMLNYILYYF